MLTCALLFLIYKVVFVEHLDFSPRFSTIDGAKLINAPFIDQRENYPTGCESISAVMALQYLGMEITADGFIDNCLPRGDVPHMNSSGQYVGSDPRKVFLGSPYSEDGWGCYSSVIKRAMEKAVKGRAISIKEYNGKSIDWLLEKYVCNGIPVLIWATIDMEEPQDGSTFLIEGTQTEFTWIYPNHCLLLIGSNEDSYYFNDPLSEQYCHYDKSKVERAYNGLNQQAIAAVPW